DRRLLRDLLADSNLASHDRALRLFTALIKRALHQSLIEADLFHGLLMEGRRVVQDATERVHPFQSFRSRSTKLRPCVAIVVPWRRAAAAKRSFPVYFSLTIRDRALESRPRPQFPRQPFRFQRRTRTAALRLRQAIGAIAAVGSRVAGSSVAKSAEHSPLEKLRDRPGPPHNQVHCRCSCARRRAPGHPP